MSVICSVGTRKSYDWEEKTPVEYVETNLITKYK